jgi:hypothetical protein
MPQYVFERIRQPHIQRLAEQECPDDEGAIRMALERDLEADHVWTVVEGIPCSIWHRTQEPYQNPQHPCLTGLHGHNGPCLGVSGEVWAEEMGLPRDNVWGQNRENEESR